MINLSLSAKIASVKMLPAAIVVGVGAAEYLKIQLFGHLGLDSRADDAFLGAWGALIGVFAEIGSGGLKISWASVGKGLLRGLLAVGIGSSLMAFIGPVFDHYLGVAEVTSLIDFGGGVLAWSFILTAKEKIGAAFDAAISGITKFFPGGNA